MADKIGLNELDALVTGTFEGAPHDSTDTLAADIRTTLDHNDVPYRSVSVSEDWATATVVDEEGAEIIIALK